MQKLVNDLFQSKSVDETIIVLKIHFRGTIFLMILNRRVNISIQIDKCNKGRSWFIKGR
jgi:hypothetical protein